MLVRMWSKGALAHFGGNRNGYNHYGKKKLKLNCCMIQQSKSLSPKDMHSHVYCSVIHNSQDIDIIRVSVFR